MRGLSHIWHGTFYEPNNSDSTFTWVNVYMMGEGWTVNDLDLTQRKWLGSRVFVLSFHMRACTFVFSSCNYIKTAWFVVTKKTFSVYVLSERRELRQERSLLSYANEAVMNMHAVGCVGWTHSSSGVATRLMLCWERRPAKVLSKLRGCRICHANV